MRLWSLHPRLLDRAALVACWREGLLAQAVLLGRTRGYQHHPQLTRFRALDDPAGGVAAYLEGLAAEAGRRGYRFDASRISAAPSRGVTLPVTRGQLDYELEHLRAKVSVRAPAWLPVLDHAEAHPLFRVVDGDVEAWEVGSRPAGRPG
ncbi:pyrimidine dimer DNA glycosylase/endonuclease V [Raineyella fluvialis]|uniref:Pyrimidine dimer DNA glycosylase n=1 Tax=Raineyella fluvialis TaxID=2662261 RepID=A0A5Q2F666_9ACTN|nr:pyrimidine dimer DNA glycosylase/endonuclease V [Raineyella fluvialis]QGF22460.1 pyrimidine dimer DNA glycosylase [Raineyella fluvialis]